MKKRRLATIALTLLLVGLTSTAIPFAARLLVSADASALLLSQDVTFASFLTFGGSMIGAALVLFIILARL